MFKTCFEFLWSPRSFDNSQPIRALILVHKIPQYNPLSLKPFLGSRRSLVSNTKLLTKSIVKPLHQLLHYTKKPICTHLQYIFCKPQVSYVSTRLQHPYPCKYSFGEDQKSWLCFILKKWESKPITTPTRAKNQKKLHVRRSNQSGSQISLFLP